MQYNQQLQHISAQMQKDTDGFPKAGFKSDFHPSLVGVKSKRRCLLDLFNHRESLSMNLCGCSRRDNCFDDW